MKETDTRKTWRQTERVPLKKLPWNGVKQKLTLSKKADQANLLKRNPLLKLTDLTDSKRKKHSKSAKRAERKAWREKGLEKVLQEQEKEAFKEQQDEDKTLDALCQQAETKDSPFMMKDGLLWKGQSIEWVRMCCCYVFLQRREDYSCLWPTSQDTWAETEHIDVWQMSTTGQVCMLMYAKCVEHVVSDRKLHVGGSSQPHFALFL